MAAETKSADAAQALKMLLEGNQRYVSNTATHPQARPSDAAQHPIAVILSCSDSRVPPELIFDQGVGGIFVVRVAGNTYDRLALQSIEYAIAHLGSRLIVVMGHDQCGAVTAAVKSYPDKTDGPMLENIYPAVAQAKQQGGSDVTSNAISDNAIAVAKRLETESSLAAAIKQDGVEIVPARYTMASGKVTILKTP